MIHTLNILSPFTSYPSTHFSRIYGNQAIILKTNEFFPQTHVVLLPFKLLSIKHLPYAQDSMGDTKSHKQVSFSDSLS